MPYGVSPLSFHVDFYAFFVLHSISGTTMGDIHLCTTELINCTKEESQGLHWSIYTVGSIMRQFGSQVSIRKLNELGIYETELGTDGGIQLLINMTEENNGTVIQCVDTGSGEVTSETTLIVPGKCTVNGDCIMMHFCRFFQSEHI